MTVKTTSGTRFFIGTTLAVGEGSPVAEYDEDAYVEVGEIENLGEVGDESPAVNFSAIGDARVRKLKGARDAGTMAVVCGRDPLNAGQIAMKAAQATEYEYNFKIIVNDARSTAYSDTVLYFRGLVMSQRDQFNGNDDVTKTMFNVAVNSAVSETPSAVIPSP